MSRIAPLIMVIDDDQDIREVLQILLQSEGYRVIGASDGLDAWEKLEKQERPSLILLDWMMPQMDGEGFMKMIRTSLYSDIPVIIMSGQKEATNDSEGLQGHFCLVKPVELEDLLAAVHRFALKGPSAAA